MKKKFIIILTSASILLTGCSANVTVSRKRFGTAPVDVRAFVTPWVVPDYGTPEAALAKLENGYIYTADKWFLSNADFEIIPSGNDFWLMPSETQYLIDNYPNAHGMDCEDGAAWLASAIKRQGLDAWFCVGTVLIDGIPYGHAWTMQKVGGQWITYETTVNKVINGLPKELYTLEWRTNGVTTWRNIGVTGSEITISQIPKDKLLRFAEEIDGQ